MPRTTVLLWWAPFVVDASANITFFVTFYHLAVVLVCIIFQCNTFHFRWPLRYKNLLKRFRSVWSSETKSSTGESCVWSWVVQPRLQGGLPLWLVTMLWYIDERMKIRLWWYYVGESMQTPLFNAIFINNCWLRGLRELSEPYQLFHLLSTS